MLGAIIAAVNAVGLLVVELCMATAIRERDPDLRLGAMVLARTALILCASLDLTFLVFFL